ncbi:MAG: KH domain-containing protein [Firmicutes bacterium]|nr:KH domain-containing protein [Bacillota bacterium]
MVELVKFIVTELVEDKNSVVITEAENNTIKISVAQTDMGKIIGKQGRVAKAIRTVVKAAGQKSGVRWFVDILEADAPAVDAAADA